MKHIALILCFVILAGALTACSSELARKDAIIQVFTQNEALIRDAVQKNDFTQVKELSGVLKVNVWENYIEFYCGGIGLVPSSSYYGFYYSADDGVHALVGPDAELVPEGKGFRWKEEKGDNNFYIEQIAEHFFYYEQHF